MSLKKKGEKAELIVCEYLKKKEFLVLERNYDRGVGEIDIIAEKESVIHFVEVKSMTRKTSEDNSHRAEEKVDDRKISHISKVAMIYLEEKGLSQEDTDWVIDIVVVIFERGKIFVKFMENVT